MLIMGMYKDVAKRVHIRECKGGIVGKALWELNPRSEFLLSGAGGVRQSPCAHA